MKEKQLTRSIYALDDPEAEGPESEEEEEEVKVVGGGGGFFYKLALLRRNARTATG